MVRARRIRGRLSGFLIFFGLIICIPGILMLSFSSVIYGKPIVEPGQQLGTHVGVNTTIELTGVMKQGNNYDIHVDIQVSATPAKPGNSSIAIRMTTQKTGTDLATLPSTHDFVGADFNSTFFHSKYEFKDDFSTDADASFSFEVTASKNIVSIYITIKLYENPHRTLASIARTIGIVLLIPGGLIILGTLCVCGRRR